MSNTLLLKAVAPLALTAAIMLPAGAMATTSPSPSPSPSNAPMCAVMAVGQKKTDSTPSTQFTVNRDEIGAHFKVTGDSNCRQTVTIATWKAPNGTDGKPYDQQTLFKSFTKTYGPGEYTIMTDLPHCFWQADLVRGSKPTDDNGGPLYGKDRMISSLHGGDQACGGKGGGTPTPTPTPTPSDSPTPTPTPTPSESPSPSQSPSVLGATLPDTGAAGLAGGALGISSMIGAGYAYIRARRNSKF